MKKLSLIFTLFLLVGAVFAQQGNKDERADVKLFSSLEEAMTAAQKKGVDLHGGRKDVLNEYDKAYSAHPPKEAGKKPLMMPAPTGPMPTILSAPKEDKPSARPPAPLGSNTQQVALPLDGKDKLYIISLPALKNRNMLLGEQARLSLRLENARYAYELEFSAGDKGDVYVLVRSQESVSSGEGSVAVRFETKGEGPSVSLEMTPIVTSADGGVHVYGAIPVGNAL